MMYQVVVEYDPERSPVRHPHGLPMLMRYARELLAGQGEAGGVSGVRLMSPVVWGCEEPCGFALFQAPSAESIERYLAGMRHARIRVVEAKYLDEVLELGEAKMAKLGWAAA